MYMLKTYCIYEKISKKLNINFIVSISANLIKNRNKPF